MILNNSHSLPNNQSSQYIYTPGMETCNDTIMALENETAVVHDFVVIHLDEVDFHQ